MITNAITTYLNRFAHAGKLTASDGTTINTIKFDDGQIAVTPANGQEFSFYFILDGTETIIQLQTYSSSSKGKFDLYINEVLDSSYDEYSAGSVETDRVITVTQPFTSGNNVIKLKINGKNLSSSGYGLRIRGMNIQ